MCKVVAATSPISDPDNGYVIKFNHKNLHYKGERWSETRLGDFKDSQLVIWTEISHELNFRALRNHFFN